MENQYLKAVESILESGERRDDRTGTGTLAKFGIVMRHDLSEGLPILTTKKTFWKGALRELHWFLSGSTNINDLHPSIHSWWAPWADEDGDVGPIYGKQWRSCGGVDQFDDLLLSLKNNRNSRRHIVSLWNPPDVKAGDELKKLPPCHGVSMQFYVTNDDKLNCMMHQRSGDMFLGVPINMASYSFLTHAIANMCGYGAGEFIHIIGDAHVYMNHIDQCREMISREPMSMPNIVLKSSLTTWSDVNEHNISIVGYNSHGVLSGEMSV